MLFYYFITSDNVNNFKNQLVLFKIKSYMMIKNLGPGIRLFIPSYHFLAL